MISVSASICLPKYSTKGFAAEFSSFGSPLVAFFFNPVPSTTTFTVPSTAALIISFPRSLFATLANMPPAAAKAPTPVAHKATVANPTKASNTAALNASKEAEASLKSSNDSLACVYAASYSKQKVLILVLRFLCA